MEKVIIPVYFDYASTLCYIAWRIVGQLEGELAFEALWKGVPISIRDFKAKSGRELGPRERAKVLSVAAETGIDVTPPPKWLDSDAALQGAELAREAGVFRTYHDAVFRAAFEDRADIGEIELLADIAARTGMDRAGFLADLASERMVSRLSDNKREADMFSALGYPSFLLGDFTLTGIQPAETMRMLFTRYLNKRASELAN